MGIWKNSAKDFISDEVYDESTWNDNLDAATKNAIRDKIETFVGGGDMLKSVYDTDNDGIVDQAEMIDGGTF